MPLRPASKIGLVTLGLVVAWAAAWCAMEIRQHLTNGPEAQASSGMYAFGDLVLGVGVFAVIALLPLALALFWLRPMARFWSTAGWVAAAYAATGPVAIIASGWLRSVPPGWLLASDARVGTMPLSALAWAAFAVFAPHARARILLAAACALDAVLFAGVIVFHFLLPSLGR
ncbi:MAG TPA: hypothetical protein VHD61_04665 [Lacunisphaera sp.]|nr:hypothetical protein [Lacunisphaera sp.]